VPLHDADLVARVLVDDDRHAFAEIVRRHHPMVRTLLRRLAAGDRARADDLAQEVFLRAYRGLGGFAGRAKLSTWIGQIAYHAFLADEEARRRERGEREDAAGEPDRAAERADLRHDLERAFAWLSPAERAALALTFGQDMTHEDAARILDCPLGTLKTNVTRGLEQLEKRMRAWDRRGAA
jgi:RNA polymerase sigma-70 factor (ECF subfamily)